MSTRLTSFSTPTRFSGWQKFTQIHAVLLLLILLLGLMGVAMMFSASGGDMHPWALRQGIHLMLGGALMLGIAVIPASVLYRYAYLLYGAGLALLLVVEIVGMTGMGARRWLGIGGVNLQPSELMKLCTILAVARYFHALQPQHINRMILLIPPAVMVLIPAALILRQPNLGTATILMAVGGVMFFLAGVRKLYFALLIGALLAAVPVGWHYLHDYQKQRVMTFMHPEEDPLGAGYNIMQSIIAIGSGGVTGKGYLQGSQGQLDFLPEKHTDFIFTMLAEEFGLVGSCMVLGFFLTIIVYAIAIAIRCKHAFGSLIALGVAAMLFMHISINVAMVMGLIPVVGVPLPLLSYGGSIMISMMAGFGLVQNAYVHRDERSLA